MKFLILLLGLLFQINNIACKYENNLKKTDYSNLENIIENYKDQISVSVVPLENEHSPFYFNKSGVFVSASMIKLLILAEFIEQIDKKEITLETKYILKEENPRIGEAPFDSMRKMMSTVHKGHDGKIISFTKGACEILLDKCSGYLTENGVVPITEEIKQDIKKGNSTRKIKTKNRFKRFFAE